MKIKEHLYFSPKYRFEDLKWDDKNNLISAFKDRIEGYYLDPVILLNENKKAFAAGVLCVTIIDFLALIFTGCESVKKRIVDWLKNNIKEFNTRDTSNKNRSKAERFYEEFRNGLVHEGKIKNNGQFSYDFKELLKISENIMLINPNYLLEAIKIALYRNIKEVEDDELYFQSFRCALLNNWFSDIKRMKLIKYY